MFDLKDNVNLRDVRQSSTRLHDYVTFMVPFPRTERFKHSISFSGPSLWNQLPGLAKTINDRDDFKLALKRFYWNVYLDSLT